MPLTVRGTAYPSPGPVASYGGGWSVLAGPGGEDTTMDLSNCAVATQVAVSDEQRAVALYEGVLGLTRGPGAPRAAGPTRVGPGPCCTYVAPGHAGTAARG